MILKLFIFLTIFLLSENKMSTYYINKVEDEIIKDYMVDPLNFDMDDNLEINQRNKILWKIKYKQRDRSLYDRIKRTINNVYEDLRKFKPTRWCGPGNDSRNGIELGHANKTDACCRIHDECPISVKSHFWSPKKLLTLITYQDSITGEKCNLKIDEKYRYTV